jgi:hypothetical protein
LALARLNPPETALGSFNAVMGGLYPADNRRSAERVADFEGPLSLKVVLQGQGLWRTGKRRHVVDAGFPTSSCLKSSMRSPRNPLGWTARASISYNVAAAIVWRRVLMRAAIGLFAMLALLGEIASAESPGVETAGLFTPLPTAEALLWRVGKLQCKCGKDKTKTITIEADDYCPGGVKPSCDCKANPPTSVCAKARN